MKKFLFISIIIMLLPDILLAQLHSESPQVQALRQELETKIIEQSNEAYYQLQEMEMERQTQNLKMKTKLKKMQDDIDELKDSRKYD